MKAHYIVSSREEAWKTVRIHIEEPDAWNYNGQY